MLKNITIAGALCASLAIAGCSTLPDGNEGVAGIDTGIPATQIVVAQADVQSAIAALPALCQTFAQGVALTEAEIAVLQSGGVNLPAKTVANISNASAKGLLICNGTAAVIAPKTN